MMITHRRKRIKQFEKALMRVIDEADWYGTDPYISEHMITLAATAAWTVFETAIEYQRMLDDKEI
jgi:hypothetical protein